jgi:hypothetical protein
MRPKFGLFLVKALWLNKNAKSDMRYAYGGQETGNRL